MRITLEVDYEVDTPPGSRSEQERDYDAYYKVLKSHLENVKGKHGVTSVRVRPVVP